MICSDRPENWLWLGDWSWLFDGHQVSSSIGSRGVGEFPLSAVTDCTCSLRKRLNSSEKLRLDAVVKTGEEVRGSVVDGSRLVRMSR